MSLKISKEELIGLDLIVISSNNPSDMKIKGKIVDETYHTICVLYNNTQKILLKKNIIFKVQKNNSWYTIHGDEIEQRPQDRIKKSK